jgi:voltage-dependent potassium channel beta subunit
MRYCKLGRWGVRVSEVGLGSWLTFGGSVDESTAVACLQRAYDQGVNFFDTANVYGRGAAEEIVGKAVASWPRESYVLATKVFMPMPVDPGREPGPNDRGLSRKHIVEQADASLRRLAVDYIDLYQCHRYDPDTPLEETCRAMDDLVRAGKVVYWGTSEWSADQLAHAVSLCRAHGWAPPVSNQPQYSAVWRQPEARVLPTCDDLGIGNVVWAPLAMGVLTGKYRSTSEVPPDTRAAGSGQQLMRSYFTQEVLDAVAEAKAVAEEAGCSLAQLALRWCLRRPEVSSVIVGATKPHHVDDNVAAADLDVDPEAVARLDALLAPVAAS